MGRVNTGTYTVRKLTEMAATGALNVPEFQRGFVWRPQQVRDLADSLARGFPIGSLLLWDASATSARVEPRKARSSDASQWIVDGQQRITAMCVLTGTRPAPWYDPSEWEELFKRRALMYRLTPEPEEGDFVIASTVRKRDHGGWVGLRDVLDASGDDGIAVLVDKALGSTGATKDVVTLASRLSALRSAILDAPVPFTAVDFEIESVAELFWRINSRGTNVREADIVLALIAREDPGWVRTRFLPFLEELEERGFNVEPALIVRPLVAIGLSSLPTAEQPQSFRLNDIPAGFWLRDEAREAWDRTKAAWHAAIEYLSAYGIPNAGLLPTKNALIPLVFLFDRYPELAKTGRPLKWFLHATRTGRYTQAGITTVESDIRSIRGAGNASGALAALTSHLPEWKPFEPLDFEDSYKDDFLGLYYYLIVYKRQAEDWISKQRLGFGGSSLLRTFKPDWHHIFPRDYIRQNLPSSADEAESFANIAIVDSATNKRFSSQPPTAYIDANEVTAERLEQQFVPSRRTILTASEFPTFLELRRGRLAEAANAYWDGLH